MNLADIKYQKTTPKEVAKILIDLFQESKEDAMICAIIVKSQINMYEGLLNPKWKFWDDVTNILWPESNTDSERKFINELVSIDNPDFVEK